MVNLVKKNIIRKISCHGDHSCTTTGKKQKQIQTKNYRFTKIYCQDYTCITRLQILRSHMISDPANYVNSF